MNTRLVTHAASIIPCLLLCHTAISDSLWQVRRAQLHDQRDEWNAMGRIPAWQVTVGPGNSPLIRVTGDEKTGDYRGIVLIGRRWTVPRPLPAMVRISLDYQTFCEMDDPQRLRSGNVKLALFTPKRWEQFATEPRQAPIWNMRADTEGVTVLGDVHQQGHDVTQWRHWRSQNIAPNLREHAGQERILAIVWGAYHFCEEWAKFRNMTITTLTQAEAEKEFLNAFDPEYPGLGEFAEAMERGDIPAAKQAIVKHMRTRKEPVPPPLASTASTAIIENADQILDHVFQLVGCPPTELGQNIQWNEDPHDYDQWAISLNRHQHWLTLGRAYAATGDEKYAREFVTQLNSWIAAMPVHIGGHWIEGPYFQAGRSPLTLDAGIRMGQTWWPTYYYFKDSPSFDVDSQIRMFRSFYRHALYLMDPDHFRVTSNWGAMEVNGLLHIAVMLAEFRESDKWLNTARDRLQAALEAQVYPDGAQIELTPGYHGVSLGNFLDALRLAQRNDVALPDAFVAGLEKMVEYYVAITMPDGRTPNVNDSGRSSARHFLQRGLELFPQREDFRYIATGGRAGIPPQKTSWSLSYAGWHIMRTGWTPHDSYLFFETGPYGAGHQHEDKLNVILYAGGKPIVVDAGNYSYDSSDWRRYVLSTRAHNTVLVDGYEQNRRRCRHTFVAEQPHEARWTTNDEFDFAQGAYRSGYGPENQRDVTHTRQVVFVKPDYWLVIDTLEPQDDQEHQYEALFHIDAAGAEIDPQTQSVTADCDGTALRIIPLGKPLLDGRIVEGQREPRVQGWLPTGRHGVLREIPTAIYRWRAVGPTKVAFILLTREQAGQWFIRSASMLPQDSPGGIAAQLSLAEGATDVLAAKMPAASIIQAGPVETDAEVALIRRTANGAVRAALQIGGSMLNVR